MSGIGRLLARHLLLAGTSLLLAACSGRPATGSLTVAAAANLTRAFDQIGQAFTAETGVPVTFSYAGSTVLEQQVEGGAPFDVFAAADAQHIDPLVASGHVLRNTRVVYAQGLLAVWGPGGGVHALADLAKPAVKFVAIANPKLAPYGAASIEALKKANLWDAVQPKVVYANNINEARQFASTGNADAAITAYSLVVNDPGAFRVDSSLYTPLTQVMGVIAERPEIAAARRFEDFVLGDRGRAILKQNGYEVP